VIENNGDHGRGISVHDAGHYGWQSSNWVNALSNCAPSGPAGGIASLAPGAAIITLGTSDQFSGCVPAPIQSRLQAIIAATDASPPRHLWPAPARRGPERLPFPREPVLSRPAERRGRRYFRSWRPLDRPRSRFHVDSDDARRGQRFLRLLAAR